MTLGHEKLDLYRLSIGVELDPMAAMLSRLGGRGYQLREDQTVYGDERNDFDSDFDRDLDEDAKEPRPGVAGDR